MKWNLRPFLSLVVLCLSTQQSAYAGVNNYPCEMTLPKEAGVVTLDYRDLENAITAGIDSTQNGFKLCIKPGTIIRNFSGSPFRGFNIARHNMTISTPDGTGYYFFYDDLHAGSSSITSFIQLSARNFKISNALFYSQSSRTSGINLQPGSSIFAAETLGFYYASSNSYAEGVAGIVGNQASIGAVSGLSLYSASADSRITAVKLNQTPVQAIHNASLYFSDTQLSRGLQVEGGSVGSLSNVYMYKGHTGFNFKNTQVESISTVNFNGVTFGIDALKTKIGVIDTSTMTVSGAPYGSFGIRMADDNSAQVRGASKLGALRNTRIITSDRAGGLYFGKTTVGSISNLNIEPSRIVLSQDGTSTGFWPITMYASEITAMSSIRLKTLASVAIFMQEAGQMFPFIHLLENGTFYGQNPEWVLMTEHLIALKLNVQKLKIQ